MRAAAVGADRVLLHLEKGTYFTLNRSGSWVWDQIEEPRSFEFLVESLVGHFDVDPTSARADLEALVRDLRADALVEFLD